MSEWYMDDSVSVCCEQNSIMYSKKAEQEEPHQIIYIYIFLFSLLAVLRIDIWMWYENKINHFPIWLTSTPKWAYTDTSITDW